MVVDWKKTCIALEIAAAGGVRIDRDAVLGSALEFWSLCSTWNLAAKLMSTRDLEERFDDHFADSITLVCHVDQAVRQGATYVDIGSGGGFPAVPLGLAISGLPAILVERSATKADFLRHAVSRLGLIRFKVLEASYPCPGLPEGPRVYTARATERPETVDRQIVSRLRPGDVYLAQRELSFSPPETHTSVERIEDEFSRLGLRRGVLYKVSR